MNDREKHYSAAIDLLVQMEELVPTIPENAALIQALRTLRHEIEQIVMSDPNVKGEAA